MVTTIQLDNDVKSQLEAIKLHPRETFNELILRMIENFDPSNADKESLIETVEILSDPETMRDLADAIADLDKPEKWTSLDEIKKEAGINV